MSKTYNLISGWAKLKKRIKKKNMRIDGDSSVISYRWLFTDETFAGTLRSKKKRSRLKRNRFKIYREYSPAGWKIVYDELFALFLTFGRKIKWRNNARVRNARPGSRPPKKEIRPINPFLPPPKKKSILFCVTTIWVNTITIPIPYCFCLHNTYYTIHIRVWTSCANCLRVSLG